MTDIGARVEGVRARIRAAAERVGRRPEDVTLLAVSKRKPPEDIVAAVRAGIGDVAENYVQEALEKIPLVHAALDRSGTPHPRWHFVGRLQRNKARQIVPDFDVVQTLDRSSLGAELERRADAAGRRLDVLVQVNVSDEPQKGGVAPADVAALLAESAGWPHLRVTGLMAIPAAGPAASMRPAFAQLRDLRDDLSGAPGGEALRALSMGMTGDFEVAIEEGATIIRVGTALFGPRD